MVRSITSQARCSVSVILLILLCTASMAKADFTFGEPTNLGPTVNSSFWDNVPLVSADGLSLFFDSTRPGGHGGFDVWVTTRETVKDPWGQPVNLGPPINTAADEGCGGISADGLSLYLTSDRPGGSGNYDIWVTTRETIQDSWGDPINLGSTVNRWADDWGGSISADGLSLFFSSNRSGGYGSQDLWVSTRPTLSDPWGQPVNLGSKVNSSVYDYSPTPSPDGLRLFFSSSRPSEYGDYTIWVTERETRDCDWGAPVNLGPAINSWADQENPYISADGSTLYFASTRPGGSGYVDLYQVSIDPVVDFNGDGAVDSADMTIMLYYWGQNEPLCDVGPTPLGDGTVDIEDLIVLAEHFGPGLECVAHWTLDETEGTIAHDRVGASDATVINDAAWRPDEGLIGGALAFDGVDDYVSTDFVANPKVGPIRVTCWVKSDVPGGSIVSQTAAPPFGATWLGTDPSDGTLQSDMMLPLPALASTAIVTDGQWHEVAAEWDGTHRRLWVDKQQVAQDAQPMTLPPFQWEGTLNIGAGEGLESDSFFSGLIDDVRIYNRAVTP